MKDILDKYNLKKVSDELVKKYNSTEPKNKRKILNEAIPDNLIIELYKNYSANKIATIIGNIIGIKFQASYIISILKKLNIKTRTISESNSLISVNGQRRRTFEEKYGIGIINASQALSVKEKKKQTNIKNWGVENVFQNEKIKEKSIQTFIKNYGVSNNVYREEFWSKISKAFFISKPHSIVSKFLEKHEVNFINEPFNKFSKYNEILRKKYSPRPDILIEDKKIVIEIYGDYWHANPKIYKEKDIFYIFKRNGQTAREIWEHDKIRKCHIESFGYKVIELWESDIENEENLNNLLKIINENKEYK